jgi:hypothetical protein
MKRFVAGVLFFCIQWVAFGQTNGERSFFRDVLIKSDTLQFRHSKDLITYGDEKHLAFYYNLPDEVCELILYPWHDSNIKSIELARSTDYVQLDSLLLMNSEYFKTRVKFINLNKSKFMSFVFSIRTEDSDKPITQEIKIFPYTKTTANFLPSDDELYIGEEKIFDLLTNNQSNIRITNEWTTGQNINYRVSEKNGQLRIHLLPSVLGQQTVSVVLQTNRPFVNDRKDLIYDLPAITRTFKVKNSRLAFLNIDKQEVTYDDETRLQGLELQIDGNRQLQVNKTYRLENQELPGGALIAELFVKRLMANDKAWCILRPYNLHRQAEGYLYIKDGDDPKFITNLSITPKTTIRKIEVMHEGEDWTSNLTVYPNETVEVKIEGEGLHKAKFRWEDVLDASTDSSIRNENVWYFRLKIPININKRKVNLLNNLNNTGYALNVREYQIPHQLDFISLNLGKGNVPLSKINPTVIQRYTIKDITLGFDNSKIDDDHKLYGKQYVDLDIRIIGKTGELIELKTIKNLVICPNEKSPRAAFYKDNACTNSDISLNTQLNNKTYNLTDFSKIQLEIKQASEKYTEPVNSKKVEIVLQRKAVFDIDLSFPAGLLIQNLGLTQSEKEEMDTYNTNNATYQLELAAYQQELAAWTANPVGTKPTFSSTAPTKPEKAAFTDNLGGISMAIIMQFSFPDPEKVGKTKPYRVGAGFLAINAFNFSTNAKRDLAAVALASVYPIRTSKLFSLPIHIGVGYKFQDKIPFVMLSPGIGIRF